ncbi:hypothetical protein AV530_016908 [Patagioenas fasciata monilis]|uniref:Uncharacterized protein n=1 Tax=Patagioenas fasciata monilis TaxID=372326 RepID=A0A1V4J589_PATFA|nr:hypothetical protein AV530_016908 [Patagioenas fasciata monilis]
MLRYMWRHVNGLHGHAIQPMETYALIWRSTQSSVADPVEWFDTFHLPRITEVGRQSMFDSLQQSGSTFLLSA